MIRARYAAGESEGQSFRTTTKFIGWLRKNVCRRNMIAARPARLRFGRIVAMPALSLTRARLVNMRRQVYAKQETATTRFLFCREHHMLSLLNARLGNRSSGRISGFGLS